MLIYFNVVGIIVGTSSKANTILIIYFDGMLTFPITF